LRTSLPREEREVKPVWSHVLWHCATPPWPVQIDLLTYRTVHTTRRHWLHLISATSPFDHWEMHRKPTQDFSDKAFSTPIDEHSAI
jgi:hypothetical protein